MKFKPLVLLREPTARIVDSRIGGYDIRLADGRTLAQGFQSPKIAWERVWWGIKSREHFSPQKQAKAEARLRIAPLGARPSNRGAAR